MKNENIPDRHEVIPSAARLATTLRDVGHDFKAAVADLIDNSISAGATRVNITYRFKDGDPYIRISDNGHGMAPDTLNEALRYGSHREQYELHELGKFGLGLKTASHSQCRQLIVATKQSKAGPVEARIHDLDHMIENDKWEIEAIPPSEQSSLIIQPLKAQTSGTVVVWKRLDRMLDYKDPSGRWAEAKLLKQMEELDQYLGMVFHRFLANEIYGRPKLEIYIRKTQVEPWDPFCRDEDDTKILESITFDISTGESNGQVYYTPYILPNRDRFSTTQIYNRAGRNRWSESQGLWIYRADRLIQDGGWSRLRTNDEKTKYARASLEFFPNLDEAFGINIAKMRVTLPGLLREKLEGPITKLLRISKEYYKEGKNKIKLNTTPTKPPKSAVNPPKTPSKGATLTDLNLKKIGKYIEKAATNIGEEESLDRIKQELRRIDTGVYNALEW